MPAGRADYARVPIGRPLPGRKAAILDSYGNPAPVGVAGELHLGGYGLAAGYLNQPTLTAERFVPDPFDAFSTRDGRGPGRLYKTGDLARFLPDGNIEFLGRVDAQIKVRGYRVELGEIETVLAAHPDVRQAAVRAREDARGYKYVVAYVVARREGEAGQEARATQLMQFLRTKLPEYMVPSSVVLLDTIPLTPAGKVDVGALPIPDASHLQGTEGYVAPRNALEQQLADLWASVLGIERVGVHDSFFDLGGHSLLATQLASRVRQHWGIEVPLRSLFESPTIAALAPLIAALRDEAAAGAGEPATDSATSDEELARLLDELDQLSDDEAAELLSGERGHE